MDSITRLLFFGFVIPVLSHSFSLSVIAAPKSDKHAATVASRWLTRTPNPLGSKMVSALGNVEIHRNDLGEALYYIVHTKPRGFIIVSVDDLIEPIIGFFPNAEKFSPSSVNPLGAMLQRDMAGRMDMVSNNSKSLLSGKKERSTLPKKQKRSREKWESLLAEPLPGDLKTTALTDSAIDDIRVSPFVESRWSQSTEGGEYCYNYYTPNHYVSGCTATAMAQVIRYYQHPQTGVGTNQFEISVDGVKQYANLRGGNGAGGVYDWANMVLDPTYSITSTEREAIGALLYDAGVSVNMSYTSGGSSASLQDSASQLITTFSYGNSVFGANYDYDTSSWLNLTEEQLEKMINSNLDAGFPVMLGIARDGGGHSILADGYGMNSSTVYHHLNLGWGGSSDGWYNIPNIQTTSYSYNVVRTVVYNIFTQGSGEVISGRIVDGTGAPVQGATVTATDGGASYTDTTDSRGGYALFNIPSATAFTVTSSKTGYTFSPAHQNVTTATSVNTHWIDHLNSGNVWGVNFTGSAVLKGDIDGNGQLNITDTILALQVVTGNSTVTAVTIDASIDVNADSFIGLAEAIYTLQEEAKH